MRKIKIALVGHKPREVFLRPGETFLGLIRRLNSDNWPLLRARSWYHNNKQAGLGRYLVIVRDGDVFAAVEPVHGSRVATTPEVTVKIPNHPTRIARIIRKETLRAFTVRVDSPDFPAYDVKTWWLGGARIHDEAQYVLQNGMHLCGDPPSKDETIERVAGTVTFMVVGRKQKRVCFKTGDTLEMLLKEEGAHTHNVYVDGRPVRTSERPLLLCHGMRIATAEWR